ncbi:MAG: hypothetical protein HUU49_00990 [Candidatus Buchananbacteria bacterium]|nr:hypothetical protein [Candidatus Buchananbacteria bacterium]
MSPTKDTEMLILADYLQNEGFAITAVFCLADLLSQVAGGAADALLLQEIKEGCAEINTSQALNQLNQSGCTIPIIVIGHYPAKEFCTKDHIFIASSYPRDLPKLAKKIEAAIQSRP